MIEQLIPWIIAISSVIVMLFGNYFSQKKILTIHNKEKMVDCLVDAITNLNDLYMRYWKNKKHNAACSLEIGIQQTLFLELLTFSDKKYKFVNKNELDLRVRDLIMQATGGEFDSKGRTESKPDKCIEISKFINTVTIELRHNKI